MLGDGLLAAYLLALDHVAEEVSFADPIDVRFDVPPEEAIDYFRRKRVVPRKTFDDLEGEARSAAFSVSQVYRTDVLEAMKEEIAQALESGATQREVVAGLKEILAGAGHRELGDFHLETITRTNMQMAYGVGRRRALEETVDDLPYWEYHAVLDDRTRPSHAACDGLVLPANHPFWDDHFPPWGFNCRCNVTATTGTSAGYNKKNPSGQAELAYDKSGVPVKAEYGTAVYDLSAGRFQGVPKQGGLKETIEQASERSQRSRVKTPQSVLDTEREIRNEPIEHLHLFDSEGEPVASFTGDEDAVEYDLTDEEIARMRGGYDVHNHPGEGAFSLTDIADAADLEVAESRVVTPTHSYVMRPPAGGWDNETAQKIAREFNRIRVKVVAELQRAVRNGAMAIKEAKLEERHRIWQLVARALGLKYKRKKL
ncbi:MAG: hypothetical protein DMF64_18950 [Acidobacteria bacterium]|nr:MAG: hypothetical protein DMF64_18950 [Acidobacteriota bacterium]